MALEVWISGNPQQLRNVEQMLKEASEEADGLRAPADGVVLKVPPVHAPKLPELGESAIASWRKSRPEEMCEGSLEMGVKSAKFLNQPINFQSN